MDGGTAAYFAAKRAMDIIGATIGLIAIAPIAPFIWIAIRRESPGPALVRLERISANRIVHVYKFRTMVAGAHRMRAQLARMNERRDGPLFKIRHDPRLTRAGVFLRKFRLDEFPQLVNVLRGELSLVGPRPHEPEEAVRYPEEYRFVLAATAGVTGLSQVSGASSLPFATELALDAHYLTHRSITFDLRIIAKTAVILFTDPTAI
ncbi:MAG: sugar transferase [Candidatus Liptonbacteria bacterium]|nr:sugar transferase [Candidatus Liptonbacteria bacterium]